MKLPYRDRHWEKAVLAGGVCAAGLATGCAKHPASPTPSPTPSAKASATPLPISVAVSDINATIVDNKTSQVVATVKASGATAGPDSGPNKSDPIGTARDAAAVLYRNGVATATMNAAFLRADSVARTVVGTGGVTLRSLTQRDTPAIRADTMTWKYGDQLVVGKGHVLITRKPDMELPAQSFVADIVAQTLTLDGDGDPNDTQSSNAPKAPDASKTSHASSAPSPPFQRTGTTGNE